MYARLARESDVEGARAAFRLRALAGEQELVLSLWESREDAERAGQWYELESDQPMGDPDAEPGAVGVYHFDGPMSPAHHAAASAANARIQAGMADHPGGVRALVLWQPEARAQVVVVLSATLESLEDGQRKVMAMDLAPGEDPALLPGPSRAEVYRVVPERSVAR
ncbi:hypothetical protein ACFQV2_38490 [Actinokineospora soli]|uniref:ABM domain-containing protein n=1 Tax=Actinokineospora soli TaxID=1048753 RepID=A0ABW2TX66_9PSEU